MSVEDYLADLSTYAHAVDEVHSVGGLHPDWGVEHYEALFKGGAGTPRDFDQSINRR